MGLNDEYAAGALLGRPAPYLVFDIETCPMPMVLNYLVDPIEAPVNYKDPVKIAAYVAEKRLAQVADAALDLDLCEIVAIGGEFHDTGWAQTRESTSEADMLDGFWRFVASVHREAGVLVGFNCLHFDLPILLRRSLYLDVPTPRLSVDKYRHDGIVDLADILSFGGKTKWRSLAFYCKRFGIPFVNTDGAEIPGMVAEGKWDDIAQHVSRDVAATHALALRIGTIHAPMQLAVPESEVL